MGIARRFPTFVAVGCFLLSLSTAVFGYQRPDSGSRLGTRVDKQVLYRVQGPGALMGVMEPRVIRRYLPQELYQENRWQTWEYTNYASNRYRRYLDPRQWGDYFYDAYGNLLTRGWLLYSWTESHPRVSESSSVLKRPRYSSLRNLIISSDRKGGNAFSIMIGDEIFSSLTPLTFRKAVFNGTQADFNSDRIKLTGVFSRISAPGFLTAPNAAAFNNYTNLIGGRAILDISDHLSLGGVLVDSHNGRGGLESFENNPLKGDLTSFQLERGVNTVIIRLSDDSPADGAGGAVLLADDVEIFTQISERDSILLGSRVGFEPQRIGGTIIEGVRTANGLEQIELRYNLDDLAVALDDRDAVNAVKDLRFRLVLVNDYKVEITSNQQTNREDQPVFLAVTRAAGNVKDGSNKKEVVFNYGVPTGTRIMGLTLEARDIFGFHFYSEFDVNHNYRKYPSRRYSSHQAHSGIAGDESARAWMMNLTRSRYPWHFFAESFYLDEDYNTSPFIVDSNGRVDYSDPTESLYDFVDDNDDHDRKPDQERKYQDPRSSWELGSAGRQARGFADEAVFPGWDQNNDFISDFNQNSNFFRENRFPDYEEPFLRYGTDRPEYLFGMDLNNNGWVDQFENDNTPDYPYKRDRKGYNAFVRYHVVPGLQFTAGRADERLISDDRKSRTNYLFAALDKVYAGRGRLRLFNMLKKAEDSIQDDLFQWVQELGLPGAHRLIEDRLFARQALINTLWIGYDYRTIAGGAQLSNKLKHEVVRQGDEGMAAGLEDSRFFGLVNKIDFTRAFGRLTVRPKFKSELLLDNTPYSMGGVDEERQEWTRMFILTFDVPVLNHTWLQWGLEQLFLSEYERDEDLLVRGDLTGDSSSTVLAAQLTNVSTYAGYAMTTLFGYSVRHSLLPRVDMEDRSVTDSTLFMTVYAGLSE